jgi:hypothetical protein
MLKRQEILRVRQHQLICQLLLRSYGCHVGNKSEFYKSAKLREEEFQENPIINWDAILWVDRPPELWAVQLLLAMVSLTEALLIAYLSYKVILCGHVSPHSLLSQKLRRQIDTN